MIYRQSPCDESNAGLENFSALRIAEIKPPEAIPIRIFLTKKTNPYEGRRIFKNLY